ncbi:DUF2972 domain-containing protein [Campylobacter lari]|uniref:DUF2972 domain-containing protein n=1 Tax=Campylobacter lari NCTC 11845 TaxID=1388749 RepID=A0A0A8HWL3_CAMLA|nr:DUF2972 domain-containing protein [Campylobacter lari]AJD01165.1 hypothetical protein (DUF2972 domain) [Campylobacter lari NCTC 11845]
MQNNFNVINTVKNEFAYKLGYVVLQHKINGGGYATLIHKLYKIRKEYKQQKTLQLNNYNFPLDISRMQSDQDCNNMRYRCHFYYLLGELLILAHKNWYKGGYFKLFSNIRNKRKEHKNIQKLIRMTPRKLHSSIYFFIVNKHLNIQAMIDILQRYENYNPILINIFNNFHFFIENFIAIRDWLLSNDFISDYEKENHPYPSLLNPKKLNNKEDLNYKTISADLAYSLNLPLPNKYSFVFIRFGLSGGAAMFSFLERCGVETCMASNKVNFIENLPYCEIYKRLLSSEKSCVSIFEGSSKETSERSKLLYFIEKNKDILILVRDPISRLKTGVNHGKFKHSFQKFNKNIDTRLPISEIMDRAEYFFDNNLYCLKDYFEACIEYSSFHYKTLIEPIVNKNNIIYLDMNSILPENVIDTFSQLAKTYDFNFDFKDKEFFQGIKYSDFNFYIPVELLFYENNVLFAKISVVLKSNEDKDMYNINSEGFIDLQHNLLNEISFLINEKDINRISEKQKDLIKKYQKDFLIYLEERLNFIKKNKLTEKDVLLFLKNNPKIGYKFKNILDSELKHIKQQHPDIIASWEYYQEFEKICKKQYV